MTPDQAGTISTAAPESGTGDQVARLPFESEAGEFETAIVLEFDEGFDQGDGWLDED